MVKKKKRQKQASERALLIALGLTMVTLIGIGVFLWIESDSGSTVTISDDGITVMTSFDIDNDSWCEQNPTFCNSSGIIDRAMCWMPSSVILPAAGSGSCWAITTMEISWFRLKQKFSFLPSLQSICDSAPFDISSYLAGIQQNRKAVDNVLGSIMTRIENKTLNAQVVCDGMMDEISSGEPVLAVILLSYSESAEAEAAHGVVAYGYQETADYVRFVVADSNTPRSNIAPETLVFSKSGGDWHYEASYYPRWHNLTIGYVKISSLGVPIRP